MYLNVIKLLACLTENRCLNNPYCSCSTFGNDLEPTSNWLEVIFSICIVLSGLLLFTLLIGNIQVCKNHYYYKYKKMLILKHGVTNGVIPRYSYMLSWQRRERCSLDVEIWNGG